MSASWAMRGPLRSPRAVNSRLRKVLAPATSAARLTSRNFGALSLGRPSFGRLSFGRVSFVELGFGRRAFDRAVFRELAAGGASSVIGYLIAGEAPVTPEEGVALSPVRPSASSFWPMESTLAAFSGMSVGLAIWFSASGCIERGIGDLLHAVGPRQMRIFRAQDRD